MKNFFRKRFVFTLICIMIIGLMSISRQEVSAHELFHINGVGIPLKWAHTTSNAKLELKINSDYLDSTLDADYAYAINTWPNGTGGQVVVSEVALANSHMDFGSATTSAWSGYFGSAAAYTLGYTRVADEGRIIYSEYDAQESTGNIVSAASIMVMDPPGTYYTLQTHDINDFNNKY